MILLKTSRETLPQVIKNAKHALMLRPDFRVGEVVLIAEKKDHLPTGEKSIRYRMEVLSIREDVSGESERIWGAHWKYIVDGTNFFRLKHHFDLQDVQVTSKNYLTGGTVFHIDPKDEEVLYHQGYMDIDP